MDTFRLTEYFRGTLSPALFCDRPEFWPSFFQDPGIANRLHLEFCFLRTYHFRRYRPVNWLDAISFPSSEKPPENSSEYWPSLPADGVNKWQLRFIYCAICDRWSFQPDRIQSQRAHLANDQYTGFYRYQKSSHQETPGVDDL